MIKLLFFSFGILEQGGGHENYIIDTSTGLMRQSNNIKTSVITASPALTRRLQYFLTIYFLRKHDIRDIHRESRSDIRRRLGKVKYTCFSRLSELLSEINENDFVCVKNEFLELCILKLLKRKITATIVIKVATPICYVNTQTISGKIHNFIYTGQLYSWLINDAASIEVNSRDDKKYLEEHFHVKDVYISHNAFNVSNNKQVRNNYQGLRILFAARLTELKGIDILIDTIMLLAKHDRFNRLDFKIAGSGDTKLTNKIIAVTNDHSNVAYLGYVENSKIMELYDWTDVTIITSRSETLNRVAVETGLASKIAISSDISGPREVIDDGITGFLIAPNPDEFFKKIQEIFKLKLKNRKVFYNIGNKAHKKIAKEFNSIRVYKSLAQQYEQLYIMRLER